MKGLQAPPKQEAPSRAIARIVVLALLVAIAGIAVYTAVTNQRIDLTEDIRTAGLERADPVVVDGLTINVVENATGTNPVVLLHDVDVTGGLILGDLSASLGESYRGVRLDLPGSGYSDRLTGEGPRQTAAGMADIVAAVVEQRFNAPVSLVGVGFGGEVGMELAHSHPDLVSGVVLVDVDFWANDPFDVTLQQLPWVGKAATYTWETGGRFAVDEWSPYCEEGGWCPTLDQVAERSFIITIENTTESLYGFRRTPEAALAPANFDEIDVPIAYVWSTEGVVPEESVERLSEELPAMTVTESPTFQAHLEDHASISSALAALAEQP